MRRLSITKSKLFASRVPTKGMITALQFGSDFWMALHGMQFPYDSLRLAPGSESTLEQTKRFVRDSIAGFLKDSEFISRITLSYHFEKYPGVDERICLDIMAHSMPGWGLTITGLSLYFNSEGEHLDE